MQEWFEKAIEEEKKGNNFNCLDILFGNLNDLMYEGKFQECNKILEEVNPEDISVRVILAILVNIRGACREDSNQLPARKAFYDKSWKVLIDRGRNAKRLIGGLE